MHNGTRVLDVHGHLSAPEEYLAHAAHLLASNGPTAGRKFTIAEDRFEAHQQRHLQFMDVRNVDVQLIGPRPFSTFQWTRPHIQHEYARITNDLIARAVSSHPDRFMGMAHLPQSVSQDTSHVVPELERCVNELGFVGAYLNPDPSGRRTTPGVNTEYWFPLYEAAQRLNVPLMVHPTATLDERVEMVEANYQIANVIEEYIAVQLYTQTPFFEKFPDLKIIVCHCGGVLDRWIKTDPHLGQYDLKNNLFFDSCAHDSDFLEAAIKQRGVDQMLFGTEAPGSGNAIRPENGRAADDLVPIIDGFAFLTDEDKKKIFHDNAVRLFPALAKF